MSILSLISIALWILVGVVGLFKPKSVKVNNRPVKNPLIRMIVCFIAVPSIGIVFLIFGLIGLFLTAPIIELINPSWLPFSF
ncbi:hypothetical protein COY93_00680 [Candidatus Uhrbacteria bacterium CG_4_10_14_0_8_um_filter_58_22]|uniref:Uncharacterized protein n=1 Tax=Candidatus Uhrbacteria bacterium CG_4_10_14_0_8_um_filter_58_22 TaxID=1975029 RepID=A0A2M7QAW8_9BACT|nr:MAG: hypothetical protein AUJ19_04235 [Parcubacteria group bacterium CG1_02_58_44]PIY63302.1 MAG: hypothetical protein COY93_00680 [Candidatus Uhrbacteria bacterium CG_4_10_14_0_8_um_filter_58_22]